MSLLALVQPAQLTVDLSDHCVEREQSSHVIPLGSSLETRVGLQRLDRRCPLRIDDLVEVDPAAVSGHVTVERCRKRELDDQLVTVGRGTKSRRSEPLTHLVASGGGQRVLTLIRTPALCALVGTDRSRGALFLDQAVALQARQRRVHLPDVELPQ